MNFKTQTENSLLAGELENGTPIFISSDRDIDASGSGVIAQNAILNASGDITGLIFARNNIDLNAQQNVNVTPWRKAPSTSALVTMFPAPLSASGASMPAAAAWTPRFFPEHQRQRGCKRHGRFRAGTAANATSQNTQNEDTSKVADSSEEPDDDQKKKGKGITLAQKVSRVTVLLPAKN